MTKVTLQLFLTSDKPKILRDGHFDWRSSHLSNELSFIFWIILVLCLFWSENYSLFLMKIALGNFLIFVTPSSVLLHVIIHFNLKALWMIFNFIKNFWEVRSFRLFFHLPIHSIIWLLHHLLIVQITYFYLCSICFFFWRDNKQDYFQ